MSIRSLLVLALVTLPVAARADIAPDPGYVESCTVANQSGPGRECRECSTYYANPAEHCATQVGEGFTQACRTRGASVWSEVWCRGAAAPAQPETPPASPQPTTTSGNPHASRGCSVVDASSLPGALLFAGWLLSRRRRP